MKISKISKVAVSALALMTLSACAKGGSGNNNNRNSRNGYYNGNRIGNGYFNNGQIGQQQILGQQQGQFPVGSTYPQPVKRVRIDREEDTTYSRVDADDVDVLDGTIIDESSGCSSGCRRPHRHDDNCRHDHDNGGSVQPRPRPSQPDPRTFPAPPGAPSNVARVQPRRQQEAPAPTPEPIRTPEPRAEQPLPAPSAPPRPPEPRAEQPIVSPDSSGDILIIYKDQLDSRQSSKANLSQTAYKAIIDELWRRLDLKLNYAVMPLYKVEPNRLIPNGTPANTGYLSSYKANEQYGYVLSDLALKLIETGACDFEELRGCVVVEKLPNGSVIGYQIAVADEAFIPAKPLYNGRLTNAVLRRDIINDSRLAADFRKLKLIDSVKIVVYSQKNSGSVIPMSATTSTDRRASGAPAGSQTGVTRIQNQPVDLSSPSRSQTIPQASSGANRAAPAVGGAAVTDSNPWGVSNQDGVY